MVFVQGTDNFSLIDEIVIKKKESGIIFDGSNSGKSTADTGQDELDA